MRRIQVIDSHTGGEPTRIIIDGGPDLGTGTLAERRHVFQQQYDDIRRAVVDEPRGSDVLIGGLLCRPCDPECVAGVIFFDTAGFLGMCGHGTIGFVVTLQHLGRIQRGSHRIETPVGVVNVKLDDGNCVTIQNVPSYRYQENVEVTVPGYGTVSGDIAWGGNWFFLVREQRETLDPSATDHLLRVTRQIREALKREGVRGPQGELVDHVELYGPPQDPANHSRNFVLCPGGDYDRSPCGTGTSAKLACLAADGRLAEGEVWRQESIIGSVFECSYRRKEADRITPVIRGTAFVSGETSLILDPADPFCMGIRL
jgi:4-hydroxyproline epimerase